MSTEQLLVQGEHFNRQIDRIDINMRDMRAELSKCFDKLEAKIDSFTENQVIRDKELDDRINVLENDKARVAGMITAGGAFGGIIVWVLDHVLK